MLVVVLLRKGKVGVGDLMMFFYYQSLDFVVEYTFGRTIVIDVHI